VWKKLGFSATNEVKLEPQYADATRPKTIQYKADKALIYVLSLFDESIIFYLSSPALHPSRSSTVPIPIVL
jgi:hypothetical protein